MDQPPRIPRKRHNSSKVNLTFSAVFHGVIVVAIFLLAAHEGLLGKKLKELTVVMVPKEIPKEKPPEPKVEPPKVDTPKVDIPQPKLDTASVAPPPADLAPAAAPAVASLPAFDFSDGAHQVDTMSDPRGLYKATVEHALRSRWNRPEDMADEDWVAEAELSIDPSGRVTGYRWLRGSGNTRWDNSVKAALDETKSISHPPPKGFPPTMRVRFDVESTRTESLTDLSQ